MQNNAIVYCEGLFGESDGKVANGLVRFSEKYKILGIIDSTKAGLDAGEYLDGVKNYIPIYKDIQDALVNIKEAPKYFIIGAALAESYIPDNFMKAIKEAMTAGMSIVNGLPIYLTDNDSLNNLALESEVAIYDIRKPKPVTELKLFSGAIEKVTCPVVAVLGLDCAIGKRTTCMELVNSLKAQGLKAAFVATGQTGILQGAKYGVPIDVINSQYVVGEIEASVVEAFETENPDIILIEGQSSVSHEAYLSSYGIIKGGRPDAFILQYAPKRKQRVDFEFIDVPTTKSEIELIEFLSKKPVIALTINHENMLPTEVASEIKKAELKHKLPVEDVLLNSPKKITNTIIKTFNLNKKLSAV
ncbi:DUF1611 domain-containing protein [Alloiococcus sp. CFN-8]|uniref:DUF1611 domain-containing protein n=1 Tax=Alloiococcus sp. CFN-8 TaxID=3416081 RepID=UPI003CFA3068